MRTGAEEFDLAGLIPFYAGLSCPIPVSDIEQLDQQLDTAKVPHHIVTYAGAPHSFSDQSTPNMLMLQPTLGRVSSTSSTRARSNKQDAVQLYYPPSIRPASESAGNSS